MRFYKVFISAFLLLAYSVGFAHGLIPHCHDDEGQEQAEHCEKQHKHHYHEGSEMEDHAHFLHENHYDDGLLDFLICVLDETEYPCSDNTTCHYTLAKTGNISFVWLSKVQSVAVLLAVFTDSGDDELSAEFSPEIAAAYSSPPLSNSPHRGPPSISC